MIATMQFRIISSYLLPKNVKIDFTICLYGSATLSLTLREEHRLRVFEKRVLRITFRPKKDEVIGGWRKLHNEEFHNLYSSLNIIRMTKACRMRWVRHVEHTGEIRNTNKILVGKPEGNNHPEDQNTVVRTILKWISEK
jgi:hypothetical protein